MRKVLGPRLIFSLTALAALGLWVACGGSDDPIVPIPDAGRDSGGNLNRDTGGPDDEEDEDSGNEQRDTGTEDTGNTEPEYDAGKPIVLDAGDVDGGIACVEGGELEFEPNNEKPLVAATADSGKHTLRPTRCGIIRAIADAGESDWLTFTLGDASTSFYVQYAGNVTVHVETDGQAPADITAQPPPNLKFVKDQPYYVQVRSKDGKQQSWRVTLFEK